jgi:phage shock protein A
MKTMGIFSRVRDIVSANINSMLDKAEDPEKMVKLMIREMEDTLVELRASCASTMAQKKKIERAQAEVQERVSEWEKKARLAVDKGRDDLAREALLEKRRYAERAAVLAEEVAQTDALSDQYKSDIAQLEDKLSNAREKKRILVQRHIHAKGKTRAQKNIRDVETHDAVLRFESFESRIDRMEAEADLVNHGRKASLEEQFSELETDEELENELEALKNKAQTPESE